MDVVNSVAGEYSVLLKNRLAFTCHPILIIILQGIVGLVEGFEVAAQAGEGAELLFSSGRCPAPGPPS